MNNLLKPKFFIDSLLKGISQIMLQENSYTGLLFLIGLFAGSWKFGVAAILAALTGNVTAIILKYNFNYILKGLYGFSPALLGVGLIFFFKPTILIWILIIVGSSLACILQHFFIKIKFPAYTFPFILVMWLIVFLVKNFTEISTAEIFNKTFSSSEFDIFAFGFRGFGQVIFQEGFISGFLFFIAVLINSRSAALCALAAVFATGFLAYIVGQPLNIIYSGAFGFNAVLSAIVFSGTRKTDYLWVAIATILTFLINLMLAQSGILDSVGGILTFAFVAGSWLTLLIQKLESSRFKIDLTKRF